MKNVFFFDSMLTPKIITVVYWVLLISVVISSVTMMFAGYNGGLFKGLGVLVGGAIAVRIWCELLIVLFKINGNLQKIADKSEPTVKADDSAE